MMRILEPFAKDAQAVRADELRNLLILSGTERELRHLIETIDMFDIDWMAGMSAGVFTLQNSDVKAVMAGARQDRRRPQHEPAHRHPAHHPDRADERAARHHAAAGVPRRGEEVDRAPRPAAAAATGRASTSTTCRTSAPSARRRCCSRRSPAARRSRRRAAAADGRARARRRARSSIPPTFQPQHTPTPPAPATRRGRRRGSRWRRRVARAAEGIGIVRNIQVVADKDNNTLLIVATPPEYSVIERRCKKLDVPRGR